MPIEQICKHLDCTGCGVCAQICPRHAISLDENDEGFAYPIIDRSCVECGLCISRCPANLVTASHEAEFFMGWNRDIEVLQNSSSGGIFTALARHVLEEGGVVYGVAMLENNRLAYTAAHSEDELSGQRRSKYYQANVGDAYIKVKKALLNGNNVLFSGTACQIAGLKSFLGREYDNLVTVDVLCHGVASRKVVKAYIDCKSKCLGQEIVDFRFRSKEGEYGWRRSTHVQLDLADRTSVFPDNYNLDTFFLGFNANLFLRESCYRCKYAGSSRVSDITLADYWGCNDNRVTETQLYRGVSLILCNTARGRAILDAISRDVEIYEIDAATATSHNRALVCANSRPRGRDTFFGVMKKRGYDSALFAYLWPKMTIRRMKSFVKGTLPFSAANALTSKFRNRG